MGDGDKSSRFTTASANGSEPLGPPLIGALLRLPWEAVQERMLERLHSQGFADFDASYLIVAQYPGPQGQRPADLAARLRISKQALNHLLGQLERRGYLTRRATRPATSSAGAVWSAGTRRSCAGATAPSTWS